MNNFRINIEPGPSSSSSSGLSLNNTQPNQNDQNRQNRPSKFDLLQQTINQFENRLQLQLQQQQ